MVLVLKKWSWSLKNRWSWSCNLMVLFITDSYYIIDELKLRFIAVHVNK